MRLDRVWRHLFKLLALFIALGVNAVRLLDTSVSCDQVCFEYLMLVFLFEEQLHIASKFRLNVPWHGLH